MYSLEISGILLHFIRFYLLMKTCINGVSGQIQTEIMSPNLSEAFNEYLKIYRDFFRFSPHLTSYDSDFRRRVL